MDPSFLHCDRLWSDQSLDHHLKSSMFIIKYISRDFTHIPIFNNSSRGTRGPFCWAMKVRPLISRWPWSRSVSGFETLEHIDAIHWVYTTCKLELFYWTIILCEKNSDQSSRWDQTLKIWSSQNPRPATEPKKLQLSEKQGSSEYSFGQTSEHPLGAYTQPYS